MVLESSQEVKKVKVKLKVQQKCSEMTDWRVDVKVLPLERSFPQVEVKLD